MADKKISDLPNIASPVGAALLELEESGASGHASLSSLPISSATQTALDGKQSADSDLSAIAALSPTNDDVIQRKAGVWTNRTMAQVKTDLALVKGDVGLGNVDNTSDANKPVSTATQTALDLKAPLASPALTGNPTAPTQSQADDSTKIATTAYVRAAIAAILNGVSSAFDTLAEIAAELALKAPLTPAVNDQTGTTYTLLASDNGKVVTCSNASAITVTVPSGLGVGFNCVVIQKGAGQITFSPSSTTLRNRQSHTKSAGQWAAVSLVAHAANDLTLGGDTAA